MPYMDAMRYVNMHTKMGPLSIINGGDNPILIRVITRMYNWLRLIL